MARDADREVSSETFVRCVPTGSNIFENVRTLYSPRVRDGVNATRTDEHAFVRVIVSVRLAVNPA